MTVLMLVVSDSFVLVLYQHKAGTVLGQYGTVTRKFRFVRVKFRFVRIFGGLTVSLSRYCLMVFWDSLGRSSMGFYILSLKKKKLYMYTCSCINNCI